MSAAHKLPGSGTCTNLISLILAKVIDELVRLATAHELLPTPDTTRVSQEDKIIAAIIQAFIKAVGSTKSKAGNPTYLWSYNIGSNGPEEAAEEYTGLSRLLRQLHRSDTEVTEAQRNRCLGIVPSLVEEPDAVLDHRRSHDRSDAFLPFAGSGILTPHSPALGNTMQDTIYLGKTGFSGYVDGTSDSSESIKATMPGNWALYGSTRCLGARIPVTTGAEFLGYWVPDWYTTMPTTSTADLGDDDYLLRKFLFVTSAG